MQDLMANGNYAPYLAQALAPPLLGSAATMGSYGGMQGIAPHIGNPGVGSPTFSQFGQGGPMSGFVPQQGFGQQLGQPQQVAAQQHAQQQQQTAATLQQLAHYVATNATIGQQVGATLQQLAQYCIQQVMAGQQFAQALNQLAQQCAWQAQAARVGPPSIHGPSVGLGQAWGPNRPLW